DRDRPQSRTPGAEVLGGEIVAHRLLQILVDLVGVDRGPAAGLGDVLENALPRQLVAMADEPGEPLVVDGDLVLGAALAAEPEQQAAGAGETEQAGCTRAQDITLR